MRPRASRPLLLRRSVGVRRGLINTHPLEPGSGGPRIVQTVMSKIAAKTIRPAAEGARTDEASHGDALLTLSQHHQLDNTPVHAPPAAERKQFLSTTNGLPDYHQKNKRNHPSRYMRRRNGWNQRSRKAFNFNMLVHCDWGPCTQGAAHLG